MAAKTLVVVESPAKAKTIKKYLGAGYEVLASKGHIKDLPKKMGVDVEKDFTETYEVIEGKEKVLAELKAAAKKADAILLATDPDREGEAIAWHIMEELKRPKLPIQRVEFHEITKKGVEHGVEHPRKLDENLYDAQRARRVLDRIVGYDVSALVWSKLAFGLSAGRVQSVALRLIVDREREIEAFVPEEYWNVGVGLRRASGARASSGGSVSRRRREARGHQRRHGGRAFAPISRAPPTGRQDHAPRAEAQRARAVHDVASSSRTRPATCASRPSARCRSRRGSTKASISARTAGPVGLITYMRTDSLRVSDDAIAGGARDTSPRRTARITCRRSRTSTSPRRTRRKRTRRSARPRSSSPPRRCAST